MRGLCGCTRAMARAGFTFGRAGVVSLMKSRKRCWGAVTSSPTTAACFPATPRAGGWATGESGPDACEGGGVANERPFGDLPRINLRGFQREAIDQIEREIARGMRRVLYAAPTGSGKTVVAAEIA